jgi:hypothetical protein
MLTPNDLGRLTERSLHTVMESSLAVRDETNGHSHAALREEEFHGITPGQYSGWQVHFRRLTFGPIGRTLAGPPS